MISALLVTALAFAASPATDPLLAARDRQDRAALEGSIAKLAADARKSPNDAEAQYRLALASSYLAEILLELKDKNGAQRAAEAGMEAAEKAVSLKPRTAEYHRVLGTLYGQVVPANVLAGLSYGKKVRDAINKALECDPRSAKAYLARGIGNYYLPPAFGGGTDLANADFRKAIEIDPKLAEAHLWLGLSLRKAHQNAEARKAFARSLELDPNRIWTKEQLAKTPAQ